MDLFTRLAPFLNFIWERFHQASIARIDPFRLPSFATFDGHYVYQRIIVLRSVVIKERKLFFFTDIRSPKVNHLKRNSQANILFYSPEEKIQASINGNTIIHHKSNLCRDFWSQINSRGRSSYATISAPGTPLSESGADLPPSWDFDSSLEKSHMYFENFAVLEVEISKLDLLHLHEEGHQRARFFYNEGKWEMNWVVP